MPTLDWLHRAAAFSVADQVPYRLLDTVSHHGSSSPAGSTDNLLIHGDNLEALKALMPFYRGRIKCIFIDPPYNTQSAFEHYDDKLEAAAEKHLADPEAFWRDKPTGGWGPAAGTEDLVDDGIDV